MTKPAEFNLQLLVSNVINEKNFSHCRLCLKVLDDQYIQFHDLVTLYDSCNEFVPFADIITNLLGSKEICQEIPGIDAVCHSCVEKTLEAAKFIENCKNSIKTLNKVFTTLLDTLNTDIEVTKEDKYLHIIAKEDESRIMLVKKEKKKQKNVLSEMKCFECDEDFDDIVHLKVHNLTGHSLLTCEYCYDVFSTDKKLNKHVERFHNKYVCKDCGISCEGIEKLHAHEQSHLNCKKNECPKCGKTYSTKEFYRKHVKLCMEGLYDPHPIRNEFEKPYVCKTCGKAYSSPGGLRVHNRFTHGDAKPHVCEYCGKKFTAPSCLKTHMVHHTGEKNFKCDICGNKFVSKEALLYHTRRHTGEKPYSCKHCDEKFVNASARAEHIKFKHVGPTLMCEICSQKFVTSHFLKLHINRHHDPSSKLYAARTLPPNMPGEENKRIKKDNS